MKNIPKMIESIILKNMSEINPLGEYSVYCNKHLQTTVLDSKIRHIEEFASKYESEVIITKKERIIGKNRVTDIKIIGFASNLTSLARSLPPL